MIQIYRYTILFLSFISLVACAKSSFLDEKPDQSLVVPESIEELQAILDNNTIMNGVGEGVVPSIGQIGSDDYYLLNFSTTSVGAATKLLYLRDDSYDRGTTKFYEWDYPYRVVFYANIALDGLSKLKSHPGGSEYNNVKGSAHFFRAHMFFQLAQVFAPPYNKNTAKSDLGIPLKLKSDISEKIGRSSLEETYAQIILDLKSSANLLTNDPKYITSPSKAAAYGLLARTYLLMKEYDSALVYSDKYLQIKNKLRDYNSPFTDVNSEYPFAPRFSCEEIVFHSKIIDVPVINIMYSPTRTRVDSNLIKSYSADDLRLTAYFNKRPVGYGYKGSYEGDNQLFGGIATDEIYLVRAECYARLGNKNEAMKDLNTLMEKRWLSSSWVPFTAIDAMDALRQILIERRKELVFRGLRWSDIRRLNEEGANIVQTRIADGQLYTLEPNSKRYTYLIPNEVISFHTDWQQNPR